jgi:hypothetical protein
MNETEVIEIVREAITCMLKVVGPIMLAGLVVGVIVSLVQTVTQIGHCRSDHRASAFHVVDPNGIHTAYGGSHRSDWHIRLGGA